MSSAQVSEGYKQTEIGVIPEDWEITVLEEVSKLSSGTTPSRAQEDRYYRNGEYHWVKTTDLNNSQIKITEEKVTREALDETCLQIYPSGTVLIAMYGGFNQIGRTGLINIPAAVNQALIAIQAKSKKLNSAYLLATLNYRVEYWKSVASSSRKDPNITSQDVKNFVFALPKVQEQSAIAQALSDIDALIASLDKLIAKQRQLKTAAMQQLLTGKMRLPGFGEGKGYKQTEVGVIPEDWNAVKLGSYVVINSGESPSKIDLIDQGIPYFKVEQLNNDSKYLKTTSYYFRGEKTVPEGSLIFPKRGASILLNKVRILAQDSFMDTNLMTLTVFSELEVEFLYYFLEYAGLSNVADTTSIPQINNKHIIPFLIPFPNLEEQRRIATVLSDMDTAIAALEARRAKTQAIKQGMMQELLTGRTRLV